MTAPARCRRLSGGMDNNLYTAVLLFLEGVVEVRTFFEMCTAMGHQEGHIDFSLPESDWLAAPYSALHVFARCEASAPFLFLSFQQSAVMGVSFMRSYTPYI